MLGMRKQYEAAFKVALIPGPVEDNVVGQK